MVVFLNPDEARTYIRAKMDEGMTCQQKFGIEGIEVFCRFAVEREAVPRPVKRVERRPMVQETFKIPEKIELPYELRDYQRNAVKFAMEHRHCIIEIPTGRGKTDIAIDLYSKLRPIKMLVIVPLQMLLDQWVERLNSYGVSASTVSGESKDWGYNTVITYQSAILNLHMLSSYDLIIFDEVHHLFSPEYRKILFAVENKPYLIGLTATVREYGEEKKLQDRYFPNVFTKSLEEFQTGESKIPVEVVMMPVRFSEDEREAYDRFQRTITRANRTLGPVPEWPKFIKSYDEDKSRLAKSAIYAYAAQKRLLTETPDKLDVIVNILERNPGQFIVFSDTIDGITTIEETIRNDGISEGSIYSGVASAQRSRIINGLRDNTIRVLVGGAAITEGLDLPDISNAILSSLLVKSSRTYVQRVGRILRPTPGKRVKLFLVYVQNTLEETNAKRVRELIGESGDSGYFS